MCLFQMVIIVLSLGVQSAPPSSWPPKMKNYDIWGQSSSDASQHHTSATNDIQQTEYFTNETSFRNSRGKSALLC